MRACVLAYMSVVKWPLSDLRNWQLRWGGRGKQFKSCAVFSGGYCYELASRETTLLCQPCVGVCVCGLERRVLPPAMLPLYIAEMMHKQYQRERNNPNLGSTYLRYINHKSHTFNQLKFAIQG